MVVDSTALPEQVVDDVITSAFESAGQRCSALRVMFIQDDIADNTLQMLAGAMLSMTAGDPRELASDLGPVIDRGAQTELQAHIDRMHREAKFIAKVELDSSHSNGSYVTPHVFEIDSLDQLTEEVFGPVLHVIRYSSDQLSSVIKQINDTGYGLTLGIHSRIEAFAETVYRNTIAGNTYINRNMVGAVVGVNPFGGRGLSGTGPKAGGPNYLLRFSTSGATKTVHQPYAINLSTSSNPENRIAQDIVTLATAGASQWQAKSIDSRLAMLGQCNSAFIAQLELIAQDKLANPIELPGPTGEDNKLSLLGRGPMVLVVREEDAIEAAEQQIISALLCGCPVIMVADSTHQTALKTLQSNYKKVVPVKALLQLAPMTSLSELIQNNSIEGVIANSLNADSSALRQVMAKRKGSIIPLIEWPKTAEGFNYHWLLWFLSERTRTENLVARGGNTQLFNLAE
jgi:RHH-type proline utilization regulon transcriptional repressor/proline dehydrogenase/delta 1-pyrroline-5-carboxylate dehydrogenase